MNTINQPNYVEGKIIAFTGCANGMGEEAVKRLSAMGATLMLIDFDEEALKRVYDKIVAAGGKAEYRVADVANYDQMKEILEYTAEKYGRLDVMVNNAGIVRLGIFTDIPLETSMRVFRTNLVGPMNGIYIASQIMRKQPTFGLIVTTASSSSYSGTEDAPCYCAAYKASKVALKHFVDDVRYDVRGIRHTLIIPPPVLNTNLGLGQVEGYAVTQEKLDTIGMERYGDSNDPLQPALLKHQMAEAFVTAINTPMGYNYGDLAMHAPGVYGDVYTPGFWD